MRSFQHNSTILVWLQSLVPRKWWRRALRPGGCLSHRSWSSLSATPSCLKSAKTSIACCQSKIEHSHKNIAPVGVFSDDYTSLSPYCLFNKWIVWTRAKEPSMTLASGRTLEAYTERTSDLPLRFVCFLHMHLTSLQWFRYSQTAVYFFRRSDGIDESLLLRPQVSRSSTRAAGGKRHPVQVWSVWEHRASLRVAGLVLFPSGL